MASTESGSKFQQLCVPKESLPTIFAGHTKR